ncbi:MAG: sulfurtransferase TusA family protein [Firmicutes bacterium]|nr:sulfurtransferase TusA family protein [Bacillota bacterium]
MEINCMGEVCPVPSLKVRSLLRNLKAGEELKVLVDHSCAVGNILEQVPEESYQRAVNEVANGIWEVRKSPFAFLLYATP